MLALVFVNSIAAAEKPVTLACNDFPPQKFQTPDESGLPGFDVEILTAAFNQSGHQVDIRYFPWNRALHLVQRGAMAGLCSCSYRPEREAYLHFSDEMGTVSSGMFSRSYAPPVTDLKTLAGRPVGVVSGYSLERALIEVGALPVVAQTDEAAVRMLYAKRFDYLYGFKAATEYHLRHDEKAADIVYREISRTPYFLCLSKNYPGAGKYLEDFNRGLEIIRDNGDLQAIMDKYR